MTDLDAERVFARVAQSMLGEDVDAPRIGRYELREKLGSGAMGEVYSAWDPDAERVVAIKVLQQDREADATAMRRLQQEARALERVEHPNVLRIFEVGQAGERWFIAMERLDGETLQARLERDGSLTPGETRAIVAGICAGIGEAHRLGIVHRDLKPANVFLTARGVKVLDFGIAKGLASGTLGASTVSGTMLGTPHYMSPEQATDAKRIDHRSDLWAVAVIAYECIVGRPPFEGASLAELSVAILVGAPPTPSQHASVPVGIDTWFARAVARDPAARFQSADELARALADALVGPAKTSTVRKRRISTAVIAAVAVGAAALVAWMSGAFDPPPPPSSAATPAEPSPPRTPEREPPVAPRELDTPASRPTADTPVRRTPKKKARANVDDLEF